MWNHANAPLRVEPAVAREGSAPRRAMMAAEGGRRGKRSAGGFRIAPVAAACSSPIQSTCLALGVVFACEAHAENMFIAF